MATKELLQWINHHNKNSVAMILCFNNKIASNKENSLELVRIAKENNFSIISYDKEDSTEYQFFHFNQCVSGAYVSSFAQENVARDVLFMGNVKDRGDAIRKAKSLVEKNGLSGTFFVPGMNELKENAWSKGEYWDYEYYLTKAGESKAIIDIVGRSNYGLTLRPIEAMFLRRKVITNYKKISEEPFYNQNNVYILGSERRSLKEFLYDVPYADIDQNILSNYDCGQLADVIRNVRKL